MSSDPFSPIQATPSDRRKPLHPDITEDLIHELVHAFYSRVRADEQLGPIFNHAIGDNWDPHLEKMCTFWSSVMRMTGRYKGKPMIAHVRQKTIRPAHFSHWLDLFAETAQDVCGAEVGALFVERAERIAESLQLGMFFSPTAPPSFKNGRMVGSEAG